MKIYDISPVLHSGIAVWPGDTPFSRRPILQLAEGASVNLSSIEMSLHTGAHADAPSHFLKDAASIDEVPLDVYVGMACLTTLAGGPSGAIRIEELVRALETRPERLLIRAHPDLDPDRFPERIRPFTVEAAREIGQAGVRLLGTDAPSVDAIDDPLLPAHRTLGGLGVHILENLRFQGVPDGVYELVALPLKFRGADASPVRAILRETCYAG